MSLKRDLEELKKGNVRFSDQIASAGAIVAGGKLSNSAFQKVKKEIKQAPPVTIDMLDRIKKRDPSLKVDRGSLDIYTSVVDEANKKYNPKINATKSDFMKAFYTSMRDRQIDDMLSGGAHYSADVHKIRLPKRMATETILEHEAGHATKDFAKKFLQKGRAPMLGIGALASLKSTFTADKAYKGKGKKRADDYRKARNEAAIAAGLLAGPTLAEEARASGYALKRMKGKRMRALRQLAPAYATYVGTIGLPAAAPVAALEYYRRKHSKGLKNGNTRK